MGSWKIHESQKDFSNMISHIKEIQEDEKMKTLIINLLKMFH